MGTLQRRTREKRLRRTAILEAARRLFWERGFVAATMPEIAEAAELAPGTLYLYFPSKSALYAELLTEGYDELLSRLKACASRDARPRRQAEALMDALFEFAEECPEYFDIIFFVLQKEVGGTRGGALEPEQVERLQEKEDACKTIVSSALQRAGYGTPDEDARDAVDAIWSMLVGTVFFFRKEGKARFAAVAGRAKGLLLRAAFGGA